ncbi:hypothetical protein SAY87_014600 [Trapa incisa]|uniref:Prefoldin n=2 Tax=Trapa TaxID=22665 RepID=A0AAN7MUF3_TRANT|nr:hypothetical protein SAY87_014600 [Trapa incisa]KAK4802270.1 hypothetical protein SAY86_000473 [Trapa natans]
MASTSLSSHLEDLKVALGKKMRIHEVSIAELSSLSSSRAAYVKNGNLYFRTSIEKAKSTGQKQLELAKAKLEKLDASA